MRILTPRLSVAARVRGLCIGAAVSKVRSIRCGAVDRRATARLRTDQLSRQKLRWVCEHQSRSGSTICASFMVVQTSSCWLPGHFSFTARFDVADEDAPNPVSSETGIARAHSGTPRRLRSSWRRASVGSAGGDQAGKQGERAWGRVQPR